MPTALCWWAGAWCYPTRVNEDSAREIALEVLRAARGGGSIGIATVITAPAGSALVAGAKLLLHADGSRVGSLGGDELEEAVAEDVLTALTRVPRESVQALYYKAEGARIHRLEAKEDAQTYEIMVEVI